MEIPRVVLDGDLDLPTHLNGMSLDVAAESCSVQFPADHVTELPFVLRDDRPVDHAETIRTSMPSAPTALYDDRNRWPIVLPTCFRPVVVPPRAFPR